MLLLAQQLSLLSQVVPKLGLLHHHSLAQLVDPYQLLGLEANST